jgi:hypothetical protein
MHFQPDYDTARRQRTFTWRISASYYELMDLTGFGLHEINLDPRAGIEIFRKGLPLYRELFGPEQEAPTPCTPAISYGHATSLGADLTFPGNGEVHVEPPFETIDAGIERLKQPVDFNKGKWVEFYFDYRRQMQEAFPETPISFRWSNEGPCTTAYSLLGDPVFLHVYDQPQKLHEFLYRSTISSVEFMHWKFALDGLPAMQEGVRIYDDIAAMLPGEMWPQFVLPFWEIYYEGMTHGLRSVHCEDMRPAQLPMLESLDLYHYDPGISEKINPAVISEQTRVPFGWRLGSFHYASMDCRDVRDFVYQAAADGASHVFTQTACQCHDEGVKKIDTFREACKDVEHRLNERGESRESLRQEVSDRGREKFWGRWPE